jgi:transposase
MVKKKFIGVDLHTDNFVVCYYLKDKNEAYLTFPMNEWGLKYFIATLSKKDELAVESVANAGFFYKKLRRYVKQITIVAPGNFAVISKSAKKTDWNDAKALAVFLSKDMLPKARLKSDDHYELRSLIDTRAQLVKMKASLSNRVCSICIRNGLKIEKNKLKLRSGFKKYVYSKEWKPIIKFELDLIEKQMNFMREQIEALDAEIEAMALDMPGYENLVSIGGIGPLSAAIFISVIGNIHDFKHPKNLASYFGIVPTIRQSNETIQIGRITKRGSKLGRTTLVQCNWVAMKYHPGLKEFYERLKTRRGAKRAMIATSRKLLTIIYDTLKNDWVFDDFGAGKYHIRGQKNVVRLPKPKQIKKSKLSKKIAA